MYSLSAPDMNSWEQVIRLILWGFITDLFTRDKSHVLSLRTPLKFTIILFIFIYLFIWGFTSLSTLYRSYHDR